MASPHIGPVRIASAVGHDYMRAREWTAAAAGLRAAGFRADAALALDLGCGDGSQLQGFHILGLPSQAVIGLDIFPDVLLRAKSRHPSTPFIAGDAARLPFQDEQFDLVRQSVMASSLLERPARRAVAREMVRVARRGGFLLWYDVRYRNPRNPLTRPITRRDLREWFAECDGSIRSMTLLPPLTRALARLSPILCEGLEAVRPLRSHLLAILRKT